MPHDCCFIRYQDHLLGCTTCITVENLSKKATKLTHIFLCYREKPGDPEWEVLEDQKQPFLLNFSQCKLCLKDYYPVIEHTTTVLKRDKGNTFHLYIVWFTFCLTFDENSFDNPTVVSCVSTGPLQSLVIQPISAEGHFIFIPAYFIWLLSLVLYDLKCVGVP